MAKQKKPEEDKVFRFKLVAEASRIDDDGAKVLMTNVLEYPELNRADIVFVQDVMSQTLQKLVDVGYQSVELRSPDKKSLLEATRKQIRG